jgi:hypothetical protein
VVETIDQNRFRLVPCTIASEDRVADPINQGGSETTPEPRPRPGQRHRVLFRHPAVLVTTVLDLPHTDVRRLELDADDVHGREHVQIIRREQQHADPHRFGAVANTSACSDHGGSGARAAAEEDRKAQQRGAENKDHPGKPAGAPASEPPPKEQKPN